MGVAWRLLNATSERKGVVVLVTITGERLPEADHQPELPAPRIAEVTVADEAQPVATGKRGTVGGMWVYVLVAGLFALFAFVAGSGL